MDLTDYDVKCESCNEVVSPDGPENSLIFALALAALASLFFGFIVGGMVGLATMGAGIAATLPLGVLGAYFGFKGGRWIAHFRDGVSCPSCGAYF
ncbi:hypothetical protein G9464_20675 [Halostella sp. JP-L12]|uniref:hypothetical protein n=1 Tax=Halostella TaxID=1843185 RepID=UPI000EF7B304|nr:MULTISPECIES: hypothetical protein [Halostella]NHN49987.1 hypothetical protein [Halostella sp. JP-L12]